jgi:hypothetical protein
MRIKASQISKMYVGLLILYNTIIILYYFIINN